MSNDVGGYKYNQAPSQSEQNRYNQSMDWIFSDRVSDGISLARDVDNHYQTIVRTSDAAVQQSSLQMLQGSRSGQMLQASEQYLAINQNALAQTDQDIAAIDTDLGRLNNQLSWMQQQAKNRPNDAVRQRGVTKIKELIAHTKDILRTAQRRRQKIAEAVQAGQAFVVQAKQAAAEKKKQAEQERRNKEEKARLEREASAAAEASRKAAQDAQQNAEDQNNGGMLIGGGTKEGRDAMMKQTRDLLTASRYAAEQMAVTGQGTIVQAEISLASETMTVTQQLGELAIRAAASEFSGLMAELADAEAIREKAFNLTADMEKNRTDNAFTRAKTSAQLSKY